jgi:hypothetical protein
MRKASGNSITSLLDLRESPTAQKKRSVTYLHYRLAANQMSSTAHHDTLSVLVLYSVHSSKQQIQVFESGCTVSVSEEDELAPGVENALRSVSFQAAWALDKKTGRDTDMLDSPAFPSILLQSNHPNLRLAILSIA